VNPWPLTRDAWRAVGARAGVPVLEVEFICSDTDDHRRRIEARHAAEPRWPSWRDVVDRDYRAWGRERLVIDTSQLTIDRAVALLVDTARRLLTENE
jgi:hypothetical protein